MREKELIDGKKRETETLRNRELDQEQVRERGLIE